MQPTRPLVGAVATSCRTTLHLPWFRVAFRIPQAVQTAWQRDTEQRLFRMALSSGPTQPIPTLVLRQRTNLPYAPPAARALCPARTRTAPHAPATRHPPAAARGLPPALETPEKSSKPPTGAT